jgi:hypothetical protein
MNESEIAARLERYKRNTEERLKREPIKQSITTVDEQLTQKEQLVIATFEKLRTGHGTIAKQNILNPNSGWREMIAEMSVEEITLANLNQK